MRTFGGVGRLAGAAVGLVLPVRCGGCGAPATSWCAACRVAARRVPPATKRSPGRGPSSWSATVCEGPVLAAVAAWKDDGRRDLLDVLMPLLAAALVEAVTSDPVVRSLRARGQPVLVVPVPATRRARRRRGGEPVADLARAALEATDPAGLALVRALTHTRRVDDQRRLGRSARRGNLTGALAVRPTLTPVVAGRACVVVDDVVTTGATLAEAARALRAAGAVHVVAATAAATPRARS